MNIIILRSRLTCPIDTMGHVTLVTWLMCSHSFLYPFTAKAEKNFVKFLVCPLLVVSLFALLENFTAKG